MTDDPTLSTGERAPVGVLGERSARLLLAASGTMIGAGGLLLGLQVDGNGELAGTGFAALSIGGLVAMVAALAQVTSSGRLPRDTDQALGSVAAFLGTAFVVGGVLAPGGPWMFVEVFVLLWVLARRRAQRTGSGGGPEVSGGALFLLGLMLLFRLWITWKGSEHSWDLVSVDVPIIASIPGAFLDPIRTVSLGSFTPSEMGFPPTGIDFPVTTILWAIGFALCAFGLWLRGHAAREHENDRIHALIHTLPTGPAHLVERLLPEEEWEALGLHGLAERPLAKRIEALVADRIGRHRQFHSAFEESALLELTNPGGFAGGITAALQRYAGSEPAAAPRRGEGPQHTGERPHEHTGERPHEHTEDR